MDSYIRMFESDDDIRFGRVVIFSNALNLNERVMVKEKTLKTREELAQVAQEAAARLAINHPNLLRLISFKEDLDALTLTVTYEFPEGYLDVRGLEIAALVRLFRDVLRAVVNLKDHKMLHGDLRSDYFGYFSADRRYKLMDRLGDSLGPIETQLAKIQKYRSLYMAPLVFNELMAGSTKVVHNAYKSEVFALGTNMLEWYFHNGEVQDFYNTETGRFDEAVFEALLDEAAAAQTDRLAAAFLRFLRQTALKVSEKERPKPKELLALLSQAEEFKEALREAVEEAVPVPEEPVPVGEKSPGEHRFYNPFEFVDPSKVVQKMAEGRTGCSGPLDLGDLVYRAEGEGQKTDFDINKFIFTSEPTAVPEPSKSVELPAATEPRTVEPTPPPPPAANLAELINNVQTSIKDIANPREPGPAPETPEQAAPLVSQDSDSPNFDNDPPADPEESDDTLFYLQSLGVNYDKEIKEEALEKRLEALTKEGNVPLTQIVYQEVREPKTEQKLRFTDFLKRSVVKNRDQPPATQPPAAQPPTVHPASSISEFKPSSVPEISHKTIQHVSIFAHKKQLPAPKEEPLPTAPQTPANEKVISPTGVLYSKSKTLAENTIGAELARRLAELTPTENLRTKTEVNEEVESEVRRKLSFEGRVSQRRSEEEAASRGGAVNLGATADGEVRGTGVRMTEFRTLDRQTGSSSQRPSEPAISTLLRDKEIRSSNQRVPEPAITTLLRDKEEQFAFPQSHRQPEPPQQSLPAHKQFIKQTVSGYQNVALPPSFEPQRLNSLSGSQNRSFGGFEAIEPKRLRETSPMAAESQRSIDTGNTYERQYLQNTQSEGFGRLQGTPTKLDFMNLRHQTTSAQSVGGPFGAPLQMPASETYVSYLPRVEAVIERRVDERGNVVMVRRDSSTRAHRESGQGSFREQPSYEVGTAVLGSARKFVPPQSEPLNYSHSNRKSSALPSTAPAPILFPSFEQPATARTQPLPAPDQQTTSVRVIESGRPGYATTDSTREIGKPTSAVWLNATYSNPQVHYRASHTQSQQSSVNANGQRVFYRNN